MAPPHPFTSSCFHFLSYLSPLTFRLVAKNVNFWLGIQYLLLSVTLWLHLPLSPPSFFIFPPHALPLSGSSEGCDSVSVTRRWYCPQHDKNITTVSTVLMSNAVDTVGPNVTWTHEQWVNTHIHTEGCICGQTWWGIETWLRGGGGGLFVSLLGGIDPFCASSSKLSHRDLTCFFHLQR